MSDELHVSGGAGGLGATYDDMLTFAGVVDAAGDEVRDATGRLVGLAASLSGDFAEAALLVPDEVVSTELKHGAAVVSGGALQTELEVTARLVRASVWAYQTTDALLAEMQERAFSAGGFLVGGAALPLGVAGSVGLLLAAASDPALAALLASDEGRAALAQELQSSLYENPWLLEALTRAAPGLVQGGTYGVLGPFGTSAISSGSWPTGDYHDALTGLLAAAALTGLLGDRGVFTITGSKTRELPSGLMSSETFLADVFAQQGQLSSMSKDRAHVQVVRVPRPDGSTSWIVQIPGTQTVDLAHADNPLDMDTNLNLMQREGMGPPTVMEQQVLAAMRRAGIGPNDPVMLTGHSQGGITAASLAVRHPDGFNIRSVVTAGAPIARFDIPGNVSVMSLEHSQDVIPKVDSAANPDRANWTTVTRDLEAGDGPETFGNAHAADRYSATGALVDGSVEESISAWRRDNAVFFSAGGPLEAETFEIGRAHR
jgi:pimeloyl-ACP methyl ester carboxylesterase